MHIATWKDNARSEEERQWVAEVYEDEDSEDPLHTVCWGETEEDVAALARAWVRQETARQRDEAAQRRVDALPKKAPTPADRIEAMKAKVAEARRRAEWEAQRTARRRKVANTMLSDLTNALGPLCGLPVLPNGETGTADRPVPGVDVAYAVTLRRLGWRDHEGEQVNDRETLIEFVATADADGTRGVITHDDTEITLDVALDLATAAVEARFALKD